MRFCVLLAVTLPLLALPACTKDKSDSAAFAGGGQIGPKTDPNAEKEKTKPVAIEIAPSEVDLGVGEGQELHIKIKTADKKKKDAENAKIEVADGKIASVEGNKVTCKSEGTTTIKITVGELTKEFPVTCNGGVLTAISISPDNIEILKGEKQAFTILGTFDDDRHDIDVTSRAVFTSTAPNVAKMGIDADDASCTGATLVECAAAAFEVVAIDGGTADVKATIANLSATAHITISTKPVDSLTLEPSGDIDITVGSRTPLVVNAKYTDGSTASVGKNAQYTSSNPAVVSIDPTTGEIVPLGPGEATITVKFGKKEVKFKVKVKGQPDPEISVDEGFATEISDGVEKGSDVLLKYKSNYSSGCEVKSANGTRVPPMVALADGDEQTVKLPTEEDGEYTIECTRDTPTGPVVTKKKYTIRVTTPKVTLAIVADGANADGKTFPINQSVTLSWSATNVTGGSCSLTKQEEDATPAVIASDLSGQLNQSLTHSTTYTCKCKDKKGNEDTKSVSVLLAGSASFKLKAATFQTVHGSEVIQPLSVVFALDVTKSMTDHIKAVRDNITAFVQALTDANFDVKLGIVTFRDNTWPPEPNGPVAPSEFFESPGPIEESGGAAPLQLTNDVTKFTQFLDSFVAGCFGTAGQVCRIGGGWNLPEASLLAVRDSMAMLASETRPNAIKAAILVSDEPGHNGIRNVTYTSANNPRHFQLGSVQTGIDSEDCDITRTVATMNSIALAKQPRYKFFYSLRAASHQCPSTGGVAAEAQGTAILNAIWPSVPLEDRGGSLGWPLVSNSLVNTVTAKLVEQSPDVDIVCPTKKVTARFGGATKWTWSATAANMQAEYGVYASDPNATHTIARTLGAADYEHRSEYELTVVRCCVAASAAQMGDFSACDGAAATGLKSITAVETFTTND